MKPCPHCNTMISDYVIKCSSCGRFLKEDAGGAEGHEAQPGIPPPTPIPAAPGSLPHSRDETSSDDSAAAATSPGEAPGTPALTIPGPGGGGSTPQFDPAGPPATPVQPQSVPPPLQQVEYKGDPYWVMKTDPGAGIPPSPGGAPTHPGTLPGAPMPPAPTGGGSGLAAAVLALLGGLAILGGVFMPWLTVTLRAVTLTAPNGETLDVPGTTISENALQESLPKLFLVLAIIAVVLALMWLFGGRQSGNPPTALRSCAVTGGLIAGLMLLAMAGKDALIETQVAAQASAAGIEPGAPLVDQLRDAISLTWGTGFYVIMLGAILMFAGGVAAFLGGRRS